MDVHPGYVESPKSALAFNTIDYFKAEDSGYHTFTPSSLECSDIVNSFQSQSAGTRITTSGELNQTNCQVTPEVNIFFCRRSSHLKPRNEITTDTPPPKRPAKRPYSSIEPHKPVTTIPTPTTYIAGKIQNLEVNEDKENSTLPVSLSSPVRAKTSSRLVYRLSVCENNASYPITPVKRNCKLTPCKKSAKKLDFAIHTLSCENQELEPKPKSHHKIRQTVARPNQNIDIVSLLMEKGMVLAVDVIFQHLSNEDICKFRKVSPRWREIWHAYKSSKRQKELCNYLKTVKENQENSTQKDTAKVRSTKPYDGCLKDIQNEMLNSPVVNSCNPQYSPRTNRFRKFTKSASLDSRIQLPCVRCSQPAKVTEEPSGEQWAECTNATCCYQFCKSCNCSRHPGSCSQYDLNAPSPSKRKKSNYGVGTKKSKTNLRRLFL